MTTPRLTVALVGFMLALAACGGPGPADTDAEAEPAPDTVVFATEAEPEVLNAHLPAGNSAATWWVTAPVLQGAFRVTPTFAYEPVLIEHADAGGDPFQVTYRIREAGQWSDGTPVSAADFVFTWETYIDPANQVTARDGYDRIVAAEIVDQRTVTFTFDQPFAPWRTLFAQVLPAHELAGADFNQVWLEALTVANGPFAFERWEPGHELVLVRNPAYGGEAAALARVVFRFVPDPDTAVQLLRGGEADVISPRPTEDLAAQLRAADAVQLDVGAGTLWEHLTLNTAAPLLDLPAVRQAIAHALDRDLVASELLHPITTDLVPLDSAIYTTAQPQYTPTWAAALAYDPEAAVALLEGASCTRGADEVFVCDGQRLSLRYATTAGVRRREQFFEIFQTQLAAVGIEVTADFSEPAVLFTERLPTGDYDLAQFAWLGQPDPHANGGLYRCDGPQNFTGHCNPRVDDLFDQADTATDDHTRTDLLHEADALLADDLPVIPLFPAPSMLAWRDGLQGPQDNPTQFGPTWNLEHWRWRE